MAEQQQQRGGKRKAEPAPVVDKDLPPQADEDDEDDDGVSPKTQPKKAAPTPTAALLVRQSVDVGAAIAASDVPAITEEKDKYMFYPENYAQFDPERMAMEGEAQKSKVGGGMMMFLKYVFPDGVTKNLCVQGPKMFLPAGIKRFEEDGGSKTAVSALASFGKEWENNPQMVAFKELCAQIVRGCARIAVAKNMAMPYCKNVDEVIAAFAPICEKSQKESKDDPSQIVTFEPAIKLTVNTAPANRTMLVSQVMTPEGFVYVKIPHDKVEKGGSIIPMINFQWMYRKKMNNPNRWSFSMHASIYQAVVGGATAFGSGESSKLVVMI